MLKYQTADFDELAAEAPAWRLDIKRNNKLSNEFHAGVGTVSDHPTSQVNGVLFNVTVLSSDGQLRHQSRYHHFRTTFNARRYTAIGLLVVLTVIILIKIKYKYGNNSNIFFSAVGQQAHFCS